MSETVTTQIDAKYRPGALNGLVKPGQVFQVDKISETEIRFRLMVVSEAPRPRLEKRKYGTVLVSEKILTNADVKEALEDFPWRTFYRKSTDWYLANLADKHGMKWATLDREAQHPAPVVNWKGTNL